MNDLYKWDQQYVWHPFTQMKDWLSEEQIIIDRAQGNYLFDIEGRKYLDGVSSLWVTVHGHCHPEINQALKTQADRLDHSTLLGLGNVPSIELAKKLVEIAPQGLTKVFYSDSGSTAVEIALKIAFQYWQQKPFKNKTKFISLSQAYHGDTIGSVSVGGIDLFHQLYKPLLFETRHIPSPHCYRCELGLKRESCELACIRTAVETIQKYRDETAAVIIEPRMQGAAGMLKSVEGYLSAVRKACTENHVLLIADEVATGFGRTGKMFACTWEDVSPDLMCVAKGLSGGYLPIAATLATEEIYSAFYGEFRELKTFFHGHTYTGNPLACAVSLKTLELLSAPGFFEKLQEKISQFGQALESLRQVECVGDIRQEGLMVGIELVKSRKDKTPFEFSEKIGHRVCRAARKHGLLIRPLGNVIVLMPPLSIGPDEIREMVSAVSQSIRDVLLKS